MKIRTITELQNDDFLNQEELAKLLRKSVRTLKNWGKVPYKRSPEGRGEFRLDGSMGAAPERVLCAHRLGSHPGEQRSMW